MTYFIIPSLLAAGYYTFSYGVYIKKNEKNKLGSFGVCFLALAGTILPIVMFFLRG